MERKWLLTGLASLAGTAVLGLAFLLALSSRADAHDNNTKTSAKPEIKVDDSKPARSQPSQALPLSQVVLYSSGVGYFQREGTVEGDARIDLSFPTQDINDLLKSMVVQDLDGGQVATVSYDSRDPIEKTLKSFAVNLTGNPTFAQILNQARGEKVEVALATTQANQPATLSGTLVGVERQRQAVGK